MQNSSRLHLLQEIAEIKALMSTLSISVNVKKIKNKEREITFIISTIITRNSQEENYAYSEESSRK